MVTRMSATCEKTTHIRSLQNLMERLSATDLTLAESLEIQPRVFELLRAIESSEAASARLNYGSGGHFGVYFNSPRRGGCSVG